MLCFSFLSTYPDAATDDGAQDADDPQFGLYVKIDFAE